MHSRGCNPRPCTLACVAEGGTEERMCGPSHLASRSQLIAAEGTAATRKVEVDELRRRAVLAEASCDALREEMEHQVTASRCHALIAR